MNIVQLTWNPIIWRNESAVCDRLELEAMSKTWAIISKFHPLALWGNIWRLQALPVQIMHLIKRLMEAGANECTRLTPTLGIFDRDRTLPSFYVISRRAKALIDDIVSRGHDSPNGQPGSMHEMIIPAGKAGLIIGRGGETIKQLQVWLIDILFNKCWRWILSESWGLANWCSKKEMAVKSVAFQQTVAAILQERAGVKMILIQDGSQPPNIDKPLRIIGDPYKVQVLFGKSFLSQVFSYRPLESIWHMNCFSFFFSKQRRW